MTKFFDCCRNTWINWGSDHRQKHHHHSTTTTPPHQQQHPISNTTTTHTSSNKQWRPPPTPPTVMQPPPSCMFLRATTMCSKRQPPQLLPWHPMQTPGLTTSCREHVSVAGGGGSGSVVEGMHVADDPTLRVCVLHPLQVACLLCTATRPSTTHAWLPSRPGSAWPTCLPGASWSQATRSLVTTWAA